MERTTELHMNRQQPIRRNRLITIAVSASAVLGLAALFLVIRDGSDFFMTADQRAQRLWDGGEFADAAETFSDPNRKAAAFFRAGDFESAEMVYGGLPSAEAAYNQGNALVMLGKYDDAVARYDIALEMRPDFEAAESNRKIAKGRADRLKFEGGDMTGGQMGADDIVFDQGKDAGGDQQQTETVAGGEPMSDQEMRAIWLRQVQTTPSDFLRAKFAYQLAKQNDAGGTTDE